MKVSKKILLVFLASLFAVSCDSKSDNDKRQSVAERPYYVREADEITGTVTVYTTMEETQQDVLREIWNKYYPNCKIEIQADSIGTLVTRIRGDKASKADVIIGGLFESDGDMYHDILEPYISILDEEQLYHDKSGYYTLYDVQVMCLVVNPSLRDELGVKIEGYSDLLNPALKGKIILAAPDSTSSGWRQLQTILAVMGDKFDDEKSWNYIENLMPLAFGTTSSKDVYNLVINGEYVVGLSYESTVVALIQDEAPIEIVYMKEGNTSMAGGGAIVKNSPNPKAAQAMMDLLASAEFQNERAKKSSGRGSNGKAELYNLPKDDALNLVPLDFNYLSKNKNTLISKWNALWARTHR